MQKRPQESRSRLTQARRIVVKVGSRVLVQRSGRPDQRRLSALTEDLSGLQGAGRELVLVSSGAVGAGMEALGLGRRPTTIPDLQMAAAVGQSRLMAAYDRLFSERKQRIAQVLLTHDDLKHRERHLNARNTMMNLLRHGILPIVNENDAVATDEIKFGDNDMLAALVALLVQADLLILLSTTDGLREPVSDRRTRRLAYVPRITPEIVALADGRAGKFSIGGMAAKLEAARTATHGGVPVVVANGRMPGVLEQILAGDDIGTLFDTSRTKGRAALPGRKQWIAFFHKAQGTLVVDEGARTALRERGKSLLPIGITRIDGTFNIGALVDIKDRAGLLVARGLVDYGSEDIHKIRGRKTTEIACILGTKDYDEVIHRDNMVVFEDHAD